MSGGVGDTFVVGGGHFAPFLVDAAAVLRLWVRLTVLTFSKLIFPSPPVETEFPIVCCDGSDNCGGLLLVK